MKKKLLTTFIKRSNGLSVVIALAAPEFVWLVWFPSGLVNSASKGEADIPGVVTASDWAWGATAVGWCPTRPAFGTDVMPEICFSSPGIGEGAIGVEGDGSNGELADCKGVPVFIWDDSRLCWSSWGEEWWEIWGDEAWKFWGDEIGKAAPDFNCW